MWSVQFHSNWRNQFITPDPNIPGSVYLNNHRLTDLLVIQDT